MGPEKWRTYNRTVPYRGRQPVLASKDNKIAIGDEKCITILDATTGSQKATLSEHAGKICALTFSVDGTLLVSGSDDKTIKLWDIQTGGVIKTFNYIASVTSVSISADNTTIATGSKDNAVCLWNIETGDTFGIKQPTNGWYPVVCFSPKDPQLLLSTGENTIRWWGTNGYCIGPPIPSRHITFSSDGTQFASCYDYTIIVQDTDSGDIVTQFNTCARQCSFSPNGKFIACVFCDVELWDITNPHSPHFVKTVMQCNANASLKAVFSSSHTLITCDDDGGGGTRFWDINHLLSAPNVPGTGSTTPHTTPIVAVSMQSKDGLAFSIDVDGVVKTWDTSTGHCRKTIQTQAKDLHNGDMQLINDKLILVGKTTNGIRIWDVEKGRCLRTISTSSEHVRISGDGFMFFSLSYDKIKAWSTWTGELISQAQLKGDFIFFHPLKMDGSKVPVNLGYYDVQAWDFGTQGSDPIQLPITFLDNLYVNFYHSYDEDTERDMIRAEIQNRVTKRELPLSDEHVESSAAQLDGHHVILGYKSGEVLILDVDHTPCLVW